MWATEHWRNEDGHAAVITALSLTVLMGFAALGVDTAMLYRGQSRLQATADLAALSALRQSDSARTGAEQALTGNGLEAGALTRIETGRYLRNPALAPEDRFVVLPEGTEGANALRVALAGDVPLSFAQVVTDRDHVRLNATALAARSGAASFSLTSHIARLDGAALNAALSEGLGVQIALTAAQIELLADTSLSLDTVLAEVARLQGLTSRNPAQVLSEATDVATVTRAAQTLAPEVAEALSAARASALGLDVAALVAGADTAMGLTITETAAEVQLTALDLLRAMAAVGLAERSLTLDTDAEVSGLLALETVLTLGAPVAQSGWLALGEAGVTLHAASARLDLDLDLAPGLLGNLGSGVTATRLEVPLVVELAGATATLDRLACDAPEPGTEMAHFITAHEPLHASNGTSVAALYLGTLDAAPGDGVIDPAELGFADLLTLDITVPLLLLPDLRVADIVVQARSTATAGQSQVDEIAFTQADLQAGRTTAHFGSGAVLSTALAGLLDPATTEIRVKPGQGGLLDATVAGVLQTVLALLPERLLAGLLGPVDAVLDQTLETAGLRVGEGELTLTGHHCDLLRLVQ